MCFVQQSDECVVLSQFGYWAGQLGDGRAHTLGQFTNR